MSRLVSTIDIRPHCGALFEKNLSAAFFGGGPCPEFLGLSAYLRKFAPQVRHISAVVFDKEGQWHKSHTILRERLIPKYWEPSLSSELEFEKCDLISCMTSKACDCREIISDLDIFIAQNVLSETFREKQKTIETLQWIFRNSSVKVAVFIDNVHDNVFSFMSEISAMLYSKSMTKKNVQPRKYKVKPNIVMPDILDNVFDGTDGLIPKKYAQFYALVVELDRD